MVLSRGFAFVITLEYICQNVWNLKDSNFTLARTGDEDGSVCHLPNTGMTGQVEYDNQYDYDESNVAKSN